MLCAFVQRFGYWLILIAWAQLLLGALIHKIILLIPQAVANAKNCNPDQQLCGTITVYTGVSMIIIIVDVILIYTAFWYNERQRHFRRWIAHL